MRPPAGKKDGGREQQPKHGYRTARQGGELAVLGGDIESCSGNERPPPVKRAADPTGPSSSLDGFDFTSGLTRPEASKITSLESPNRPQRFPDLPRFPDTPTSIPDHPCLPAPAPNASRGQWHPHKTTQTKVPLLDDTRPLWQRRSRPGPRVKTSDAPPSPGYPWKSAEIQ
jgi:hypothetical protein